MVAESRTESWGVGAAYEPFIGRWSWSIAGEFLRWLDQEKGRRWVELGRPFLGGQGPAPAYVASLRPGARDRLRERLRARLVAESGPIELRARAWAVRGRA